MRNGPGALIFSEIGQKVRDFLTIGFLPGDKGSAITHTAPEWTQYRNTQAYLSRGVGLNKEELYEVSLVLGRSIFAMGAEASYDSTSGNCAKYSSGVAMIRPYFCASVLLLDKGDTFKASCIHYLDKQKTRALVGEFTKKFSTKENVLTVGGSYEIGESGFMKMKINSCGKLGAAFQINILDKLFVTISTEDKTPRYGGFIGLVPFSVNF